jgi:hypothetical protein
MPTSWTLNRQIAGSDNHIMESYTHNRAGAPEPNWINKRTIELGAGSTWQLILMAEHRMP